ncbi:MAG: glycosyltransferase family 4 protein [Arenicella sp.]
MPELDKTALITSIQPTGGGVPRMVRFIIACLLKRGYKVRLAYYEPYSVSPWLSIPLYRCVLLPFRAKKRRMPTVNVTEYEGITATGIGCWAPELEFTNYWQSSRWKAEIEQCDFHLCVSGSNLAALPFLQMKLPFLAWVATPWLEDREHRVSQFPWYRRCLDAVIVQPMCRYLEKRIHQTGNTIALSDYTRRSINQIVGPVVNKVMFPPVDTEKFSPVSAKADLASSATGATKIRLGFVGRFEDPRKNIGLLLDAFALCRQDNSELELVLIGDTPSEQTQQKLQQLAIKDHVSIVSYVSDDTYLVEQLQSLSVFIIPSHQEGLCIAALEAMSCGVPVISTHCGGPQDYVKHGENGLLVADNAGALKEAVLQIIDDTAVLSEYSTQARKTAVEQFSAAVAERRFWQYFTQVYP